jgi:hypothetical protein
MDWPTSCEAGEALSTALSMAAAFARKGTPVRLALHALRCVPRMGLREGIAAEAALFGMRADRGFIEGSSAFSKSAGRRFQERRCTGLRRRRRQDRRRFVEKERPK